MGDGRERKPAQTAVTVPCLHEEENLEIAVTIPCPHGRKNLARFAVQNKVSGSVGEGPNDCALLLSSTSHHQVLLEFFKVMTTLPITALQGNKIQGAIVKCYLQIVQREKILLKNSNFTIVLSKWIN